MKLISKIDPSINFIEEQLQGFLESRYVRKCDDYFICYLSSQSGCNKGCAMCHLTSTKQTKFEDTLPIDFLAQASRVLKHYSHEPIKAKWVNFNFMARGEALSNKYILNNSDTILYDLGSLATSFDPNLSVKFNISTIMPKNLNKELQNIFKIIHPTMYYSLYSVDPLFRKKWLPQALPINDSLELLKNYQIFSKKKVKIHHCFIEGENDSENDIYNMVDKLNEYNLDCEFNLVRYNQYSPVQGRESSESVINRNILLLDSLMHGNKVQIIQRVGADVYASCGTFVEK